MIRNFGLKLMARHGHDDDLERAVCGMITLRQLPDARARKLTNRTSEYESIVCYARDMAGRHRNGLPHVHTMWLGDTLSRLELLTLASVYAQGHSVTLWAYDEIRTALPNGIVVKDAERIFKRSRIRAKACAEPDIGIGEGSFGGVFSDLFRYLVLFEYGGIWVDMDVTALRPLDFPTTYAFRPHYLGIVGSIMKCPQGSDLMQNVYEATERVASEHTPWLLPIEILSEHVRKNDLGHYIVPEMSNRDRFSDVRRFIESRGIVPEVWFALHWCNERWRTLLNKANSINKPCQLPDKDSPPRESTLYDLYVLYELCDEESSIGRRETSVRRE